MRKVKRQKRAVEKPVEESEEELSEENIPELKENESASDSDFQAEEEERVENDLFDEHFSEKHSETLLAESGLVTNKQFKAKITQTDNYQIEEKTYKPAKATLKFLLKLKQQKSEQMKLLKTTKDIFLYSTEKIIKNTTTLTLNHVLKTSKIALKKEKQGYTRPKILIILPFKNNAYEYIQEILKQSQLKPQNHERFIKEFYAESEYINKSDEYKELFKGNIDDCFKIGLKFTRTACKLFSSFYSSDYIIASPLGLYQIIQKDADFLSSIEIAVFDNADVFMMQNFDHVKVWLTFCFCTNPYCCTWCLLY
jgi:U3 small nucleolar RNA-associated protein 25